MGEKRTATRGGTIAGAVGHAERVDGRGGGQLRETGEEERVAFVERRGGCYLGLTGSTDDETATLAA